MPTQIRRGLWLTAFLSHFVLALTQVFDDEHFRSLAADGLDAMYNCEFDQAHLQFTSLQAAYPNHPGPLFLMGTNRWWQSYLSADNQYHAYIDSVISLSIEANDEFLKESPHQIEYTFFGYMGYALRARLRTLQQEWLGAANQGRKALPFLSDCLAYTTESPEFYFAAGIYHYYAETYPRDHFYVRPFMVFFPNGDAELGVSELEQAVAVPNFTRPEAMYYLSYIYLEEVARDPEKARQISAQLYREYPRNPWFACEYARVRVHTGYHAQALTVLDSLVNVYQTIAELGLTDKLMVRVHHYRGLCLFHGRGHYEAAIEAFQQSIYLAEGNERLASSDYVPANYYYLACCYRRLDYSEEAKAAFRKVLASDNNERYEKRAKKALADL